MNFDKCACAAVLIVLMLNHARLHGESVTAPLNGAANFTTDAANGDELYVTGDEYTTIRATSAIKFQGAANSEITVVTGSGTGTIHVADVVNRQGPSLYRVYGSLVNQGGGGIPTTGGGWKAQYDKGGSRLVMYVNTPPPDDDYVIIGNQATATLTVTMGGVQFTDTGWTVNVECSPGSGQVGFPSGSTGIVCKNGGPDYCVFPLSGITAGQATITGVGGVGAQGTATATVAAVSVAFSNDPIQTGYTLPTASSTISSQAITATVTPANLTANVQLAPSSGESVIVGAPTYNVGAGTITFNVAGRTATPANKPGGDSRILATCWGNPVGSAQVVVVIPYQLNPVSTNGFQPVTGVNQQASATTTPAYWGQLAPGAVHLWTYYGVWQNIAVLDQFGNPLDPMYQGVQVSELVGQVPINQTISAQGTYQDPVGAVTDRNPANFQSNDPIAVGWPAAPLLRIIASNWNQQIQVTVGGHSMHPGVRNRIVTSQDNPPAIQIQW